MSGHVLLSLFKELRKQEIKLRGFSAIRKCDV